MAGSKFVFPAIVVEDIRRIFEYDANLYVLLDIGNTYWARKIKDRGGVKEDTARKLLLRYFAILVEVATNNKEKRGVYRHLAIEMYEKYKLWIDNHSDTTGLIERLPESKCESVELVDPAVAQGQLYLFDGHRRPRPAEFSPAQVMESQAAIDEVLTLISIRPASGSPDAARLAMLLKRVVPIVRAADNADGASPLPRVHVETRKRIEAAARILAPEVLKESGAEDGPAKSAGA